MLSSRTEKLIEKYQEWYQYQQIKQNLPTISVDEVASRVAAFYEKVKGIIDWREEHLLRKRAIERSLKRRIIFSKEKKEEMAESLVYELIRGGHFPNESIPEFKIKNVDKILEKYFFILENSPDNTKEEENELQNWLIEIASYELEKTLAPRLKEESLIEHMFQLMKEQIVVKGENGMTENEKNVQVYIAVQKALFKLDEAIITYNLLEKQYSTWQEFSSTFPQLPEIAKNIFYTKKKIRKALDHPLAEKFYRICEKYDTPYLILGDVIEENPMKAKENLETPTKLGNLIRSSYDKRLRKTEGVMKRAAIYATLSIFITKITIALLIEIPLDKFITGDFNYLSLGVNILFPPLLMFLLVKSVGSPKKDNFERATMEVMKLIVETEKKDIYEVKLPQKRGKILNAVILITYFLTFLISFGVIIWALRKLHFGTLSIIIFIIFLSMISFFGVRIRERGREMIIEKEKETFFRTLIDFFTLPIVRAGKWLSQKWAKMNIALIIAALIDMPLLTFVKFLEQWRYFLKEKKEEIH